MSDAGYVCGSCGQRHSGLPLSFATDSPYFWYALPPKERKGKLTADICEIRGNFFIRGNIQIPILDGSHPFFVWTVWTSLSETNYRRANKLWRKKERINEPPYFGWLNTELPVYPVSTLDLKTQVHTQPLGCRPLVELEPTDHPLAVEQRQGITMHRVHEIIDLVMGTNSRD
jgi:hypothetical protein